LVSTTAEVAGTTLRFIDADGHVLEPPEGMRDYAPTAYRDRIWHVETDFTGDEWLVFDGERRSANHNAFSGVAGMSLENRERAQRGELRYSEVRPAAYNALARLEDMSKDGIDQSVLYPTSLLGIAAIRDVEFASAQCQAYNDWLSDHVTGAPGKLFGVAIVPQQSIEHTVAEIRRVADKPGIVGIMLRPNPTEDWKPFSDPVYDPIWRATSDAGLPIGFHPQAHTAIPGACVAFRLNRVGNSAMPPREGSGFDNLLFAQSFSNPVDMMYAVTFTTMGGVCERFPEQKFVFLEANGGWIVPWLERLDHNYRSFPWDAPYLKQEPSAYFRRQCWISFDPDESTLAFTADSPLVGENRIVWASDYPHPDAKFPGVTAELAKAMEPLTLQQQRAIAGDTCRALYSI
jgi:predicted TIM-barrel fold metal-dependent hydrolase